MEKRILYTTAFAVIALLFPQTNLAQADFYSSEHTVFFDDPNNYTGTLLGDSSTRAYRAQQFTPQEELTITAVKIPLYKTGSPTDNLLVTLRADSSDNPDSTVLATASINGASLTSNVSYPTLTFDTPVLLSASTKYWLHLARDSAVNGSNYYRVYYNVTDIYPSHLWKVYNTGTASWSSVTGDYHLTYYFDIEYETTVVEEAIYYDPEQATRDNIFRAFLLFLLTLGGLVFYFMIKYKRNG